MVFHYGCSMFHAFHVCVLMCSMWVCGVWACHTLNCNKINCYFGYFRLVANFEISISLDFLDLPFPDSSDWGDLPLKQQKNIFHNVKFFS